MQVEIIRVAHLTREKGVLARTAHKISICEVCMVTYPQCLAAGSKHGIADYNQRVVLDSEKHLLVSISLCFSSL